MNKYYKTEIYDDILEDLLRREPELDYINDYGVSVGVVASKIKKKNRDKIVFADCRKVPDIYSLFIPYDFLITVYEPNCTEMTEDQARTLLFHELLHIGVSEANGKVLTYTRPHDLEDFKVIIQRYGVNWSE